MLSTDSPTKIVLPFAQSGGRVSIPVNSQIGIVDGAASLADGFPPLTRTPPSAGGIPPNGLEMNGILYLLSAGLWWQQAGGSPAFDPTFAAAIGGYPNGAVVQSADRSGFWRSTADSNTNNPDTGGANWVPVEGYGTISVALASTNVTLTVVQAMKPQIVLAGTLGANINLIFPAWVSEWLVINNCTGGFTITAKTAGGSGVPLQAGPNLIYADGTNVGNALSSYVPQSAWTGSNQQLAEPGFQVYPGGLIEKWGKLYVGNPPAGNNTAAITFPTPFPNGLIQVQLTVQDQNPANNLIVSYQNPSASGFTLQYQETASAVQDATVHWTAKGY